MKYLSNRTKRSSRRSTMPSMSMGGRSFRKGVGGEKVTIHRSINKYDVKNPYIVRMGDIQASFPTRKQAEKFERKEIRKYYYSPTGNLMKDDEKKLSSRIERERSERMKKYPSEYEEKNPKLTEQIQKDREKRIDEDYKRGNAPDTEEMNDMSHFRHSLDAREMFKERYPDGSKNFMTPNVIRYGKIDKDTAYELSSGSGFEAGTTIYGVTIIERNKQGKVVSTDLSKGGFTSKEKAENYIKAMKS